MANVSVYGATEQKQKKPNILFIAIDDLNDWTDMLEGNAQARTPQMDKLASKGIVFTNAHCASAVLWSITICHYEWNQAVNFGELHK